MSYRDMLAEQNAAPAPKMDNQTIVAVEALKTVCIEARLMRQGDLLPDNIPKTVAIAAIMIAMSS